MELKNIQHCRVSNVPTKKLLKLDSDEATKLDKLEERKEGSTYADAIVLD